MYANGEVPLAASLLRPAGNGPFPAAVILQGSGNSDRSNAWAREFAEVMATHGIAVLLTDKRGCGKSGGDWRTADYRALAGDALAGVELLANRPEIRADAIGLVGLSQGGQVAPLAASLSEHVAFVVNVVGSATTAVDQVNFEMRNTFRQAGLDEADVERGMELQALAGRFVRTGEWEPYEAALRDALESSIAPVAKGFPSSGDSWVWTFWRGVIDYDPLIHWGALEEPVLVLYGAEDDNVPVEASVARLREAFRGRMAPWRVEVFDGSGHALYAPDATEPHVRDDALQLLVSWIHETTR